MWTSPVKFLSLAYRHAVAHFEKTPTSLGNAPSRHKILTAGDRTGCWQVLFPYSITNVAKADDQPLVLRGDFHGTRILLLSDLSRAGQDELLTRTNDLTADIVVAGLPTEGEPLCDALIDTIRPKVIVIADTEFPATRRASRALCERLEQRKIPVIYTRTAGAARIMADQHCWGRVKMEGEQCRSEHN